MSEDDDLRLYHVSLSFGTTVRKFNVGKNKISFLYEPSVPCVKS